MSKPTWTFNNLSRESVKSRETDLENGYENRSPIFSHERSRIKIHVSGSAWTRWGSLERSPRPPTCITLWQREGGERGEWEGREGLFPRID